jgi:hypothetical protein|tara:strand:- start:797 stop:985 length:189 start_codon:yes stop_codon:yes gene_type:complete
MESLIKISKSKDRQSPVIEYLTLFNSMEKVDQIETLVSIEKEIAATRRDICDEIFKLSKGKF